LLQKKAAQTKDKDIATRIEKIECRLRIEKIININQLQTSNDYKFINYWHRASRLLFSDESISLRNVDPLLEIIRQTDKPRETLLAELLLSKMPSLGEYTCFQFATTVLRMIDKPEERKKIGSWLTPMQILVGTALRDKKANLCSYSEFVRRMKNSHQAHPIIRLAAWVKMIHQATPPSEEGLVRLDALKQLRLIDQVGFPLILNTAPTATSLFSCQAFTRQGDYSDIDWMADSMQHGYSATTKMGVSCNDVYISNMLCVAMPLTGAQLHGAGSCSTSPMPRNTNIF